MRRATGLRFATICVAVFFLALARTVLAARLTLARAGGLTFEIFLGFLAETFLRAALFFFAGRRGARGGAFALRVAGFFALAAGFRAAVGGFAFIR